MNLKKLRKRLANRLKRMARERRAIERLRVLIAREKKREKQQKKNRVQVMFDSIDVSQIPANARAVAGYTSGHWPTFPELEKRFPGAHKLSIAVSSSHDAECLDIEPGDATPADAAKWVRRQHARGIKRPVLYCSVSAAAGLIGMLSRSGISRNDYRLWTAHYTYSAHICGPDTCGELRPDKADATQWTDKSLGRNLDESKITPEFFG